MFVATHQSNVVENNNNNGEKKPISQIESLIRHPVKLLLFFLKIVPNVISVSHQYGKKDYSFKQIYVGLINVRLKHGTSEMRIYCGG